MAGAFFAMNGASAGEAAYKIALAGDSTVVNYPKESPTRGWGQEIGTFLKGNVEISNFAMGGRSTKTFISEGRWDKLLASKPDCILLQFGHNDSHAKDKPEATDAATDYKDYLRKYVDDARKAGVKIVFITSMHRRTYDKAGKPTEELLPYVDAMKSIAAEKGVPLVDLHESSGKLLAELGEEKATELYCSEKDRSHFSEKGAVKMASFIVEGLKRADPELAAKILK